MNSEAITDLFHWAGILTGFPQRPRSSAFLMLQFHEEVSKKDDQRIS